MIPGRNIVGDNTGIRSGIQYIIRFNLSRELEEMVDGELARSIREVIYPQTSFYANGVFFSTLDNMESEAHEN